MPLIIMTGMPSTGKTRTAGKIKTFFEEKGKTVILVSEESLLSSDKNTTFSDSKLEKELRGRLKSEVIRLLSKDAVVICDGLNYIKGFRYELYCASKSGKTTQATVQCDLSPPDAQEINQSREQTTKYSDDVFSALVQRYEAPISSNRWDSPLYLVFKQGDVDCEAIYDSLYNKAPPPPNQSTQCQPLSSTNFLYELDRVTQSIVARILEAQKTMEPGQEVLMDGTKEKFRLERSYTLSELSRHKRQFITYAKHKAVEDVDKLASMFVQYLSTSLTD
jgi:protein KTI12